MKYSSVPNLACISIVLVLFVGVFIGDLKASSAIEARSVSWERIAAADVIVQGELDLSTEAIANLNSAVAFSDISLPLKVTTLAKGNLIPKKIMIHFTPKSSVYAPSAKMLAESNRKHLIAFLSSTDKPNEFYFVDNHCSVIPCTNSQWLETTKEVKKQRQIIDAFSKNTIVKNNPSDLLVKQLLNDLTIEAKQEQAWNSLMNLKKDQLTVLVKHMNDTRSLKNINIAIDLPAPAFESVVHYSPPTVLDAVSIVLNHKAKVNLRCLPAGGSAAARKATLESWEIWAVYSSQHKLQTTK